MKALITGISGQDGAYLAQILLKKGYEVHGADINHGGIFNWRLKRLNIEEKVVLHTLNLVEYTNVADIVRKVKPDEVYNFAALSFVQSSFDNPLLVTDINAQGALRLLEAIRTYVPKAKFFQASSSEMFGNTQGDLQNEKTPFHPTNPYGSSKLFAHWAIIKASAIPLGFSCSLYSKCIPISEPSPNIL